MEARDHESDRLHRIRFAGCPSAPGDETVNSTERKSNNFIARRLLLAYFVLSYAFFWGFLALIAITIGMLRLPPNAMPASLSTFYYPYIQYPLGGTGTYRPYGT
jgi:hypothetical protein